MCELIVQRRYSESWSVSGPHCPHSPTLPLPRSQPVIVTVQGSPSCKSQKRHLDNINRSPHPGPLSCPSRKQPGASVLGSSHKGAQAKSSTTSMETMREMPHMALLAGAALVACVFLALISALRRTPKDAPRTVKLGVIPVLGNIRAFLASPLNMISNCYEK